MSFEKHQDLANYIKKTHLKLRLKTQKNGQDAAWAEHCDNLEELEEYSKSMLKLATEFWEKNANDVNTQAHSRIDWIAKFCHNYYLEGAIDLFRSKDLDIGGKMKLNLDFPAENEFSKLNTIDVGSCYNPFRVYQFLDVTALDLCPAKMDVHKCDILNVKLGNRLVLTDNSITQLAVNHYHIVIFCFLLEYLPTSVQRKRACKVAYDLLRPEGLLMIATPDSKHVGANGKLMKNWRYTLSLMGFNRIKYEKFPHMHCMAFRKTLHIDVARRWALLHQEPYMNDEINIPQDANTVEADEDPLISESREWDDTAVKAYFDMLPCVDPFI